MVYRIVFLLFFSLLFFQGYAQTVDQRVEALIRQEDWFTLDEEYPQLKDKIQSPILKGWAEMMLKMRFNVLPGVMDDINYLLMNYQQELDSKTVDVCIYESKMMRRMGYYEYAATRMREITDQLLQNNPRDNIIGLLDLADHYERLGGVQPYKWNGLTKDVEVPMRIKKVGETTGMFIPVKIHGKEYDFWLDTGSPGLVLSQEMADEIGVKTILDSIMITGAVGNSMAKVSVMDSLWIGDIVCVDFLVHILPPNLEMDTLYKIDAIIGTDVLNLIGECRIYPTEGKVVFPMERTPLPASGRNMIEDEGRYYLKVFSGDERLAMLFDTGYGDSYLSPIYYDKHQEELDLNSRRDSIRIGGIGGVNRRMILRLDSLSMRLNETDFTLKNICISPNEKYLYEDREDGVLGMSFISLFPEIIINFREMFVEVKAGP